MSNSGSAADGLTHRGFANGGFETMRSSNVLREGHNHSLASGSCMNSSGQINQGSGGILNMKTRFSRPITSKTVRRMFGGGGTCRADKSPGSRASFGRSL